MKKPIIDLQCFCGKEIPHGRKRYCSEECQAVAYLLRKREKRLHKHRHRYRCVDCEAELSLGRPRKRGGTLSRNAPRTPGKVLPGGFLAKGAPQGLG